MNYETMGMTRNPDHHTSLRAASKVRRFTLREQVIEFAKASLAHGLTDDDLKTAWPEKPESSMRKRRTELAQEHILVENGFTRRNVHGQDEKVFVHRDFHPSPPPIVERDTTPKQSKVARLEALVSALAAELDTAGVALGEAAALLLGVGLPGSASIMSRHKDLALAAATRARNSN